MLIDNSKKIKDLQAEFHKDFPYLKLEFYKGAHQKGEASPARQQLDNEQLVGNVRSVQREGSLLIRQEMTVSELERQFLENFGLNAQVFRRSGTLWLQTSATDNWTLAEQNRKGGHSEQLASEKQE